jgi:hypothetical protein
MTSHVACTEANAGIQCAETHPGAPRSADQDHVRRVRQGKCSSRCIETYSGVPMTSHVECPEANAGIRCGEGHSGAPIMTTSVICARASEAAAALRLTREHR